MQVAQQPLPIPSADCHTQRVRRYLRFLGCPESVVDDIVQEALLAGLGRWPQGQAPLSWLLATARNQLRNYWRGQGAAVELADADRLDDMWQQHFGEEAGDARKQALRQCLQELPERSRLVLELRYGDGLGRDEIGVRVGLGAEGIKSLLVRVRDALARCVRRRCDG